MTWPVTIWIAKLLNPADYGFLAIVGLVTRFLGIVAEAGIGTAIVTNPAMDDEQLRQLNSVALIAGLSVMLTSILLAWPLGLVMQNPSAGLVLIAFGITLLIDSLMLVPTASLRRAFSYKQLALLEGARHISALSLTLGLAYAGAGFWALVLGNIAGQVVQTAGTFVVAFLPYARPRWSKVGETLRFSGQLVIKDLGEFLSSSSDRLIGGILLGNAALGGYIFASVLAFTPSEKVSSLVARVVPSVFGRLRDDTAELNRYILRIAEGITIVTVPAFVGLALVAEPAIFLVLGAKWEGAIVPLQLFCWYAAILDATRIIPTALATMRHGRALAQNGIAAVLVYPPLFFVFGKTLGTSGLALTWLVVGTALSARLVIVARRQIGLSLTQYLRALAPSLSGCLVMAFLVRGSLALTASGRDYDWASFLSAVGVGVIGYVTTLSLLYRDRVTGLIRIALQSRSRDPSAPAET